jgi:hypothetical protein
MRWFWQRKKPTPPPIPLAPALQERPPRVTSPRGARRTAPLPQTPEPRDEVLAFARDALNAEGARVRVEDDDLVTAAFPNSEPARYTTSLQRARAEEGTTLLTQGAPALEALFETAERRARLTTASLAPIEDPAALAMRALANSGALCGRCAGDGLAPPFARHSTCDACPLRAGALAIRWESAPVSATTAGWEEETSVELTYRVGGRDRRGRRDEWLRLAFSARTGEPLPLLTNEALTAASAIEQATDMVPGAIAPAATRAEAALRLGVEALGMYLSQRMEAEYQRRIEDITTTHDRLTRERPQDEALIAASRDRDLASLNDVYGVEVEAALESACVVRSPLALVSIQTESGPGPIILVDAGRGVARELLCATCKASSPAGRVCAHGHFSCARCATPCARCGAVRCLACGEAKLSSCGLCRDPVCDDCARTCRACGGRFCADHIWACVEGDKSLCLRDLTLCAECHAPLCDEHARACAACGQRHCPRHTSICKAGGELLCPAHAATCATCHGALCESHTARCEECGQPDCADDLLTCEGCGRTLCACAGLTPCVSCGARYCARCHAGSATCPACRALTPATADDLALLRLAAEYEPAISLKRAWLTGQNARARVYVSRGLGREEAYLISERGEILTSRRKGWRAG